MRAMDDRLPSRPHVLVMTSTFPRWAGDTEPAFVFELSRRLASKFDITVLAPRAPGSSKREIIAGLKIIRFPYFFQRWENLAMHSGGILNKLKTSPINYLLVPFFFLGQLLTLIRLLHSEDFALIHAHWLIPQGFIAILGRYLTRRWIPLLCTSHGGDLFALKGYALQHLKRWIITCSQALTVVSVAMLKKVIEMGISPHKVRVISMGVDLRHHYILDHSVNRNTNELLFVGRLVEKKGVRILLEAMPEVIKRYSNSRLLIAGSGPLEAELRKITRQLGLSYKVNFLGMVPQSQLPVLYQRAAIAIFPFLVAESGDQEGLGLVQIEAMGCGCPVIAGNVPAVHDTVIHEKTGLLVPYGDSGELAKSVIRMLDDPELRLRLATEARMRALKKFDWEIIANSYAKTYFQLTNNKCYKHA